MNTTAYNLFLLFVVSWFLHLPSRIPVLGMLRMDLLLLLCIGTLAVIGSSSAPSHTPAQKVKSPGPVIGAIIVYAVATLPLVEWPGTVLRYGIPEFIKAAVFYFFTVRLVTNEKRLRGLLYVFVAAMTFRVVEPLYLHVTEGYWGGVAYMSGGSEHLDRLSGAPHDVVNPNGLALVALTVIPFLHYGSASSRAVRIAYVTLLPLVLWALVLTGSRSGMLGLVAVYGAIWFKSAHRVAFAAAAAVVAILALPALPPELADRYLSIVDSNTKNAETAEGRLDGLERDFKVALRRPLFGHGLGTSLESAANFAGNAQRAHNLYIETLQELGFIGFGLLAALLVRSWVAITVSVKTLRRATNPRPFLLSVGDALLSWLWLNVIFSVASYGLSSYEWYFAAGLAEVLVRLAAVKGEQPVVTAPSQRFGRPPLSPVLSHRLAPRAASIGGQNR